MLDEDFDLPGCLARVRRNDQSACRALVEHLYPLVIRIVRARLPRRSTEEDMAQEIFMKLFSRLDQYKGSVPFPHWVSRIAVTTCIDQFRAQKRRPEFRWADLSQEESEVLQSVLQDDATEDPADAVAGREILAKMLDTLGPKDRTVITMLDLEQRTLAEIAALTGWTQTVIKVRAFRARRKLRQAFELLQEKELNESEK